MPSIVGFHSIRTDPKGSGSYEQFDSLDMQMLQYVSYRRFWKIGPWLSILTNPEGQVVGDKQQVSGLHWKVLV